MTDARLTALRTSVDRLRVIAQQVPDVQMPRPEAPMTSREGRTTSVRDPAPPTPPIATQPDPPRSRISQPPPPPAPRSHSQPPPPLPPTSAPAPAAIALEATNAPTL